MMLDAQQLFSDAQALTATAASTNILDMLASRAVGEGEPMAVCVCVDVAGDRTTGDETYSIAVQTDDDVAFGSPTTVATRAAAVAELALGQMIVIPVPQGTPAERYMRLNYTLAGTTPTWTVTAFLQPLSMVGKSARMYAGGYTVA